LFTLSVASVQGTIQIRMLTVRFISSFRRS